VNVGPNEKERVLMWELTPHNDAVEFAVLLQTIGASADRVLVPPKDHSARAGRVQGSLRCEHGGRCVLRPVK
jgi:hypothetical protein